MHLLQKTSLLIASVLATGWAHGHEGHGLEGASHWHATDTAGWIAAVAAIAVGVWLSRK